MKKPRFHMQTKKIQIIFQYSALLPILPYLYIL